METPKQLDFKEIYKEKALKEYPGKKLEWIAIDAIDIRVFQRIAYTTGYLQAQTDILKAISK